MVTSTLKVVDNCIAQYNSFDLNLIQSIRKGEYNTVFRHRILVRNVQPTATESNIKYMQIVFHGSL